MVQKRFEGEAGDALREKMRLIQQERMKDPTRRERLSTITKAHFDKVGRKEYRCDICNLECKDKYAYTRHCNTEKHMREVNMIVVVLPDTGREE